MKNLCGSKLLKSGLFIIAFGVSCAFSQSAETALIERYISKHAKSEGAEEYAEARKIVRGDINHDGKADIVILYTLEGFDGGNNYLQYLVVFLAQGNTFRYSTRAAVGGKLQRDMSIRSISGQAINLDTMEYRSKDPACCPSRKGKTRFVYNRGKLKEIR